MVVVLVRAFCRPPPLTAGFRLNGPFFSKYLYNNECYLYLSIVVGLNTGQKTQKTASQFKIHFIGWKPIHWARLNDERKWFSILLCGYTSKTVHWTHHPFRFKRMLSTDFPLADTRMNRALPWMARTRDCNYLVNRFSIARLLIVRHSYLISANDDMQFKYKFWIYKLCARATKCWVYSTR